MKLQGQLITGKVLEDVRSHLGLSLLDYCWILGIYSATYTRITNKNKLLPVDHVHAALVRYLAKHYPDYPYHRVVTPTTQSFTTLILNQLRNAYEESDWLVIGGEELDLSNNGHLATILFRSYSSAIKYDAAQTVMPLPVARWGNLVIECMEQGQTSRIKNIINEEAEAHGIEPGALLSRGW